MEERGPEIVGATGNSMSGRKKQVQIWGPMQKIHFLLMSGRFTYINVGLVRSKIESRARRFRLLTCDISLFQISDLVGQRCVSSLGRLVSPQ